jgi:uncharacterized protein YkwD
MKADLGRQRAQAWQRGCRPLGFVAALICGLAAFPLTMDALPVRLGGLPPDAPALGPPVELRLEVPAWERLRPHDSGSALYEIGQPTGEEQLYLELMNRARADPVAEGERLRATTDTDVTSAYAAYGVDLDMMVAEFSALSPVPPLAMNAALLEAARGHSDDMLSADFQGHEGSDGSTLGQRVTAQGYPWSALAENVYAYARSVWHAHAGFNVDWGPGGAGGMQAGRGHRVNIHSGAYREVGVGVVWGRAGTVGPQLVTQDFGTRQGATPLVTGVAYYDLNGNGFYDVGEGIGGVTVTVDGAAHHGVTANSGGYAVPVPGNGTYTVRFDGSGLVAEGQTVEVTGFQNVKLDYRPPYSPPVVTGPGVALFGRENLSHFARVGGAVLHQVQLSRLAEYTRVEGAEAGMEHVTVETSPGYEVVSTSVRAAGTGSFHLAHPAPATDQVLMLAAVLRPGDASELFFQTRLGWASASQVARVEVSVDEGGEWVEVWRRVGTGTQGQTTFEAVTVSLGAYAGQTLRIRFVYDHVGGTYYAQTSDGVGWYLDEIGVTDAEELVGMEWIDVPGGDSFVFTPVSMDDQVLRVRAQMPGGVFLPWGPVAVLPVSDSGPVLIRIAAPVFHPERLTLRFRVESGTAASFEIQEASEIEGIWSVVEGEIIRDLGEGEYEVELPRVVDLRRFYRVMGR